MTQSNPVTANNEAADFSACPVPAPTPPVASDAITAIAPDARAPRPCNFGFLREACVDNERIFVGFASTKPGTASPWHDHGEATTYVLPLRGRGAVEFGRDGEQRIELSPDGTVYVVPPGLRHREVNTGSTENQFLIVRLKPAPRAAG